MEPTAEHDASSAPADGATAPADGSEEARREQAIHRIAPGEKESPETILRRQLACHREKYTLQRKSILIALMNSHEHFDADWLHTEVNKRGVKAAKATVYRTLALFCECGLAREVFHGPRGATYEHIYGHQHHEHMICLECGKTIEFTSRRLEKLQSEACRAFGFHAVRHRLQVFGYCTECHPCGASLPPLESPAQGKP